MKFFEGSDVVESVVHFKHRVEDLRGICIRVDVLGGKSVVGMEDFAEDVWVLSEFLLHLNLLDQLVDTTPVTSRDCVREESQVGIGVEIMAVILHELKHIRSQLRITGFVSVSE